MDFKLSFGDYNILKKKILGMKQKDLSRWIKSIYKSGYSDGVKAAENYNNFDETMDWVLVKTAIRATERLSEGQKEKVISTIEKLCFDKKDTKKGVKL